MTISSQVDEARRRIWTAAEGLVTYEELEAHITQEEQDGTLGHAEIIDARGAKTDVTSSQVHALVHRTNQLVRRGRFGALGIVTDSDLVFGMARMYQILCERLACQIGVFRELDEALAWLDASTYGERT